MAPSDWSFTRCLGRAGGHPVAVGLAGTQLGVYYVLDYLRQISSATTVERTEITGPVTIADAERFGEQVDVLFVETTNQGSGRARGRAALVMPLQVHMVTHLAGDPGDLTTILSGEQRRQHRRRIETLGLRYEISHQAEDFSRFFERMYLPTLRARHGAAARIVDRQEAKERLFDGGHLLLVYAGDRAVGGTVNQLEPGNRLVNARLVGVLDGALQWRRAGVVKSAAQFLLKWAWAEGYHFVDFQGCEPFLRKGTFQAKLDFGARPALPSPPLQHVRLWLSVRRDNPAVREFLVANPLIVLDRHDRLGAVYFYDCLRPPRHDVRSARHGFDFESDLELTAFLSGLRDPAVGSRQW